VTRFALALVAAVLLAGNTGCCCLFRELVYWKKVHCNPCGDFCPCPHGYDGCGHCGDHHGWQGGHGGGCGDCGCEECADCGTACHDAGPACDDCAPDCGSDCGTCCGHPGGGKCSLFKRLWGGHCHEGGCGEVYWGDWHGEPADCCCEPCDHWGNWIGPHDGHYAPYRSAMPAGERVIEENHSDDLPPPPPEARRRPNRRA